MELSDIVSRIKKIFEINEIKELPKALYETVIKNKYDKYAEYEANVGELQSDQLQRIFQYFEADRKEKKQDFTPTSLARLSAKLTDVNREKVVLDLCAGSGALTIQKWILNKNLRFVCYEVDKKVIPFLLFNLAVRNINATVINGDALQDDIVFEIYNVKSGEKYSEVFAGNKNNIPRADTCVSNPPFNIKWNPPIFAQIQSRFVNCEIPPESNANYAFILTAIDKIESKCAIILPNNVLSTNSDKEKNCKKYLVESNLIEAVISCPPKMFENTNIGVCILVFNKNKSTTDIEFIDLRRTYETESREQRSQFGGKSHQNRVYKKDVNVLSEEHIERVIECIFKKISIPGFSKTVSIEDCEKNDYNLAPSIYIDFKIEPSQHRAIKDIVKDLNYIAREKSVLKLTINQTTAKKLGFDIELFQNDEKQAEDVSKSLKIFDEKYDYRPFIKFSKNKNEFKIENQDKEILSSILKIFLPIWKQHIFYLNEIESGLLAELRDAMLPKLMNNES